MTAVYSCVRILSEAVAGLPLHVYRYGENGSKVKSPRPSSLPAAARRAEPRDDGSFNFRETLMGHLLLWGTLTRRSSAMARGEVIGLYPLMPTKMTVDRDSKGQIYYLYTRGSDDSPVDDENGQFTCRRSRCFIFPVLAMTGLWAIRPSQWQKTRWGWRSPARSTARSFSPTARPRRVLEHPAY